MISADDYENLKKYGTYTVSVNYNDVTTNLTLNIITNNYVVKVVYPDNKPVTSGVSVQWCTGNNCFLPVAVNNQGLAEIELENGDYYIHIEGIPTGYTYDPNIYTTSANNKFVELGISPTGVYKNANNINEATTPLSQYKYDDDGNLVYPIGATIGCQMHYESYLFCDTLKWVNNEWINYILPQTYWARSHRSAPFERLINWWNMAVKNKNVNLYAGMGIYMWTSSTTEAYEQLKISDSLENVMGTSIYSYKQVQQGYHNTDTAAKTQMSLVKTKMWTSKVVAPEITGFDAVELGSVQNFMQYENTICFSALENAKFCIKT